MRIRSKSFRLTRAGWLLLALAGLLALGAFDAGLNMTYLLASLLLAVLAVATVAPVWMLRGIQCRRTVPTLPFAGEPYEIRLTIENASQRFAGRIIKITEPLAADRTGEAGEKLVLRVGPRQRQSLLCRGQPHARGVYRLPQLRWSSGFPFGLAELEQWGRDGEELLVLPARGRLQHEFAAFLKPRGTRTGAPSRMGLPGADFRSLREYVRGDNPHRIHWRASARQGKLYVREMERERSSPLLVMLDSRLPKSLTAADRVEAERALELAISFVAEVCRVALVEGDLVTLVAYWPEPRAVGASGTQGAAGSYSDAEYRGMVAALARLQPSTAETADALIEAATDCGLGLGRRAIVVSPISATAAAVNKAMPTGSAPAYVASESAFGQAFALTRLSDRRRA